MLNLSWVNVAEAPQNQKANRTMKNLTALLCALALLGSMAIVRAETCCEKAKAAGKDCAHPCCAKAKKDGKTCTKCNPPKDDKTPKALN
jgi:hypothetical protein